MCKSYNGIKEFQGPPAHWLKGHTDRATFNGNGLKFHVECATQYKTAYPLWFGPLRSALVLCHPDTIKTVLSGHVPKEEFVYNLVVPFTGKIHVTLISVFLKLCPQRTKVCERIRDR